MDYESVARNIAATKAEVDRLNERAIPMGYAVLPSTREQESVNGSEQTFQSSFSVRPFGYESGRHDQFLPDIEAVELHLDHLESLPWWQLDLTDDSIEVDGVALTITEKATGEEIHLGGPWWVMVQGSRTSLGQAIGEGLTLLRVRAQDPPEVGRWRKAE